MLLKSDMDYEIVLVDPTKSPIERSKKAKAAPFRKEKRHTLKTQVVVNKKTQEVICTDFSKGKRDDFRFLKSPRLIYILM